MERNRSQHIEKGMSTTFLGRRTGCRLAAPPLRDRDGVCLILTFKNVPILGPRSGVSSSGVFGGWRFLGNRSVGRSCPQRIR
jgi:hypothetical protein